MKEKSSLDALRKESEDVLVEIMRLMGKRSSLARSIAETKMRQSLPIEDLEVERRLNRIVRQKCKAYGVDPNLGLRVLNLLIEESKNVQSKVMEKSLTKKAGSVSPYAVFERAKQMEKRGKRLIHLEIGEPDFGPPEKVKKALEEALHSGHTHYTETAGIPELRAKIAEIVTQRVGTDISPKQVLVTLGGRYAVFLCIATTLLPGDEALIIEPAWPAYKACVKRSEARPIIVPTELAKNWMMNIDSLQENISKSTKMIILNNPNNPTGKIFNNAVLERMVTMARENGIWLLSDEVYSSFAFSPFKSILEFPECRHVCISSFSKEFGMTGFRIGYSISDAQTIDKMTKLQNLSLTSPPEFVQYAALAALNCVEEAQEYAKTIKSRMNLMTRALRELPLLYSQPDGGFYIFPKLKDKKMDGQVFSEKLLVKKGVSITPGTAFGDHYNQFVRLSVCQPQGVLLEAVKRMKEMLG